MEHFLDQFLIITCFYKTRTLRKSQLNTDLLILPVFTLLNNYKISLINRSISPILLHDLNELVGKTTEFTVDTEHDYYTTKTIVLLIEMHHLPYQCSKLFWLIKSVLKVIFNSTNYLFSWGNAKSELNELIPYGLLTSERLRLINDIDIQKNFRNWHNNMLKQKCGVRSVFDADNMLHSTAFTFNEFFETMSKSSQGQYRKETTTNNKFSIKQENNGQQQLSSIQSSSSSNDTPTKISALTEKEDIIHGQEVQATDDMPPLASLLSCFVRIVKCQVDKDIYIPDKNIEGNHELQEQAVEKEHHSTTCSQPLNFDTIEITSSIH
ncbi:unnamed protein product [Rotaria magnacalcarata]|uniref:Uncharacterized protein n=2 Tax=Rotaria magnacalcarata TaxID=392030 RepID=A0A819F287_9BILA|nr:unnamed protein product [Rotaria magnacalcarata]CAF3859803.1 unnamed protein product [Rotaria magnacalcarata]CAF3860539.1 unnamed protein product [Rotaria magnacalcarata]CAF3947416.1 unnamed protein product [Rotaria magnacalcarata]